MEIKGTLHTQGTVVRNQIDFLIVISFVQDRIFQCSEIFSGHYRFSNIYLLVACK